MRAPLFSQNPPSDRTPTHCTSKGTQHQTKISRYVSKSEIRGAFVRGETLQPRIWISRRTGNRPFIHISAGSEGKKVGQSIFNRGQRARNQWQAVSGRASWPDAVGAQRRSGR